MAIGNLTVGTANPGVYGSVVISTLVDFYDFLTVTVVGNIMVSRTSYVSGSVFAVIAWAA